MDSLASLAVPPRSCRSAWFPMHYNLCRAANPSQHANPSTGGRCSCSSLCGTARGTGGTQFWFNSALKRWLRGAVIDMWASSVRRQLWLVEPAVNHPLPLVPLSADSGLWRSSLSLVCMVTSHRVCKRQCALWIRFNFIVYQNFVIITNSNNYNHLTIKIQSWDLVAYSIRFK